MTGNQNIFQQAMNQGHSAAWDQDWEQAVEFYRKALQEIPDSPIALTSLGLAWFELKRFDEALKCYIQAAKHSTEDALPVEKMARIYERLGKPNEAIQASLQAAELYLKGRDADKAIDNFNNAINLHPEHMQARTRLALIYERMGRKQDAITEYLSAASIMQRSGDIAKAAQVVDHCLKVLPDNAEAKKAQSLLQKNQLLPEPSRPGGVTPPVRMAEVRQMEKTQEPAKSALSPISEARQKVLVQLAALLFEQPEDTSLILPGNAGGTQHLRRAPLKALDYPQITVFLGQAIDAQTKGGEAQAAKDLEKVFDMGLSHPAVIFNLGLLLSGRDDKKALRFLQLTTQTADFGLASYLIIGQINSRTNNHKEAAIAYLYALCLADMETVKPQQAEGLRQIYEPMIETQAHKGTKEDFVWLCSTISTQINRQDWRDYLQMARAQLPAIPIGSPPLPLSELLLETSGSHVVETIGHIIRLANQHKLDSAMEEAFFALSLAPAYLPLHVQIGELLFKKDLINEAVNKFNLIGPLYSMRGETSQAIGLLIHVIHLSPLDISVRENLVDLLISQNRNIEAVDQMIGLAECYESLADIDKMRQTYTEVLRVAQQSKAPRSKNVEILYKIADIDLRRLDWRQAVRVFEQIRTLEPGDANARSRLVGLNIRLGQIKIAINEIDSLATALENSGKADEAIKFVEGVAKEWQEKIEVRRYLGELYARNNQISQAVKVMESVLQDLSRSGNQEEVVVLLQRIIALNPPNMSQYQTELARLKKR